MSAVGGREAYYRKEERKRESARKERRKEREKQRARERDKKALQFYFWFRAPRSTLLLCCLRVWNEWAFLIMTNKIHNFPIRLHTHTHTIYIHNKHYIINKCLLLLEVKLPYDLARSVRLSVGWLVCLLVIPS